MALKVVVHVHGVAVDASEVHADIEVHAINGFVQRTVLHVNNSGALTAAQAITGLKNQIITFALNTYGQTIVASEILITGGLA